jgi:hypothetical protein
LRLSAVFSNAEVFALSVRLYAKFFSKALKKEFFQKLGKRKLSYTRCARRFFLGFLFKHELKRINVCVLRVGCSGRYNLAARKATVSVCTLRVSYFIGEG